MRTAIYVVSCLLFVVGLLGCQTQREGAQRGMEFDKHLTMTEAEVRQKYGEPEQCGIYPVSDFLDELHRPVYKKYSPHRLDTQIKEMCYDTNGFQIFFWLESKRQQWRVVGDAKYPKGVVF